MSKLLYSRPILEHQACTQQLELFHQDTLDIESWLRRKAEEWESKDQKLARRLHSGADAVEKIVSRLKERLDGDCSDGS